MRFSLELKPREVEAYLREQVLKHFGDSAENATTITSRNGYYSISIPKTSTYTIKFENFRKKETPRIVSALKYLSGGDEYFEEPAGK